MTAGEPGPYGEHAMAYFEGTDIGSPIPLWYPGGTKAPAAKNCTGYAGMYPGRDQVGAWAEKFSGCDIGLRLVQGVIGLDLDLYAPAGETTSRVLQKKWGKLPSTWSSTSRDDGSGIYLYRVKDGIKTDLMRDPRGYNASGEQVFGGFELVRWCHRFVTCAPSRHPREGRPQYQWRHSSLNAVRAVGEGLPRLHNLAALPDRWAEGLLTGRKYGTARVRLAGDRAPHEWLKNSANGRGRGEMCHAMQRDLGRYAAEIVAGGKAGGCYNALRTGVFALVGNAGEGCAGGYKAVGELCWAYIRAMRVNGRRSPDKVHSEMKACVRDAIEKKQGELERGGAFRGATDPCEYRHANANAGR